MGKATAPRVQALISTGDNAWIEKHKPKGQTVSKFVASLIAEAIDDKERRKKIGAESGDAVRDLVLECAAQLEGLNNLCRFYNRTLKEDIRHYLDGTQFEDGLLYEAFIKDASLPKQDIKLVSTPSAPEPKASDDQVLDLIKGLSFEAKLQKMQIAEDINVEQAEAQLTELRQQIQAEHLPTLLKHKLKLQTNLEETNETISMLKSL